MYKDESDRGVGLGRSDGHKGGVPMMVEAGEGTERSRVGVVEQ